MRNAAGTRDEPSSSTDHAGHYARYMKIGDPLADSLAAVFADLPAGRGRRMLDQALEDGIAAVEDPPAALIDLFAQVDSVPIWVDWAQIERGGGVFLRSGLLGISVLNLASLPLMYSSPSGNKPLVLTGHLLRRAPRRLAETARFVVETSRRGGLRRNGDGFKISIKVRMMHAQVRRLMLRSGRWQPEWGTPVNQIYMAGTNIALSVILFDGLRRFGLRVTRSEAEAVLKLWRYSGHLLGVMPELLCSTETEGRQILEILRQLEGIPDQDSKALLNAVMTASYLPRFDKYPWLSSVAYGVSRALIGEAAADALGYPPRSGWTSAVHAARPLVATADLAQRLLPRGRSWATQRGEKFWDDVINEMIAGRRPDFDLNSLPQQAGRGSVAA